MNMVFVRIKEKDKFPVPLLKISIIYKGKFENRRFSFDNLAEPEHFNHLYLFGSARLGYIGEN